MELIRTRAAEMAAAPLLIQVAEVILLSEARGAKTSDSLLAADVRDCVKNVLKEVDSLSDSLKNMSASSAAGNDIEAVSVASDNLLIAGAELARSVNDLTDNQLLQLNARQAIGANAKSVSQMAMKALLAAQRCQFLKLVKCLETLRKTLTVVLSAEKMENLVSAFKQYTLVLVDVLGQASSWQRDLTNAILADELALTISTLRRMSSLLSRVLQSRIMYPENLLAEESQAYVTGQILLAGEKMLSLLSSQHRQSQTAVQWQGPGYFVERMDKILECLSPTDKAFDMGKDYDILLESVVRHATSIAYLCSQKQWARSDAHDARIIQSCLSVLRSTRALKHRSLLRSSTPDFSELRAEVDEERDLLISDLHDLERHVNAALLEGIVSLFKETTEPLDRLIHAALHCPEASHKSHALVDHQHLKAYIDEFENHANSIYLIAGFIADSSTEEERVRTLKGSVANLQKIDPELLPAVLSCHREGPDSADGRRLKGLHAHWSRALQCLVTMIDEVTDPMMFVNISEAQLTAGLRELSSWRGWYRDSLGCNWLISVTRAMTGRARRAAAAAKQAVSCCKDPIARRMLNSELNELKKAIGTVSSACQELTSSSMWQHHTSAELEPKWTEEHQTVMRSVQEAGHSIVSRLALLRSCLGSTDCREMLRTAVRFRGSPDREIRGNPNGRLSKHCLADNANNGGDGQTDSQGSGAPSTQPRHSLTEPVNAVIVSSAVNRIESDDIQLVSCVTEVMQQAVACQWPRVHAVLKATLLPRVDNIIEVADTITSSPGIAENDKEDLRDRCSSLQALTSQLLPCLEALAKLQCNDVGALQLTIQQWCNKVTEAERFCNAVLAAYKILSDDMVAAAALANSKAFKEKIEAFRYQHKVFEQLVELACGQLQDSMHFFSSGGDTLERIRFSATELSSLRHRLESACNDVLQTADGAVRAEKHKAAVLFSWKWASNAHRIGSEVRWWCDTTCAEDESRMGRISSTSASEDYSTVLCEIADAMDALRLCCDDSGTLAKGRQMITDVRELAHEITSLTAISSDLDRYSLKAALLRCQLRIKVIEFYETVVDPVLSKICRPLCALALLTMAARAKLPETSKSATHADTAEQLLLKLSVGLSKVSRSVAAALELDRANGPWGKEARQSMDDLSAITSGRLRILLTKLGSQYDRHAESVSLFKKVQRQWAYAVVRLDSALQQGGQPGCNARQTLRLWMSELGIDLATRCASSSTTTPLQDATGHRTVLQQNKAVPDVKVTAENGRSRLSNGTQQPKQTTTESESGELSQPSPAAALTSAAAKNLSVTPDFLETVDTHWRNDRNPLVKTAQEVMGLLSNMAAFMQLEGPIQSTRQMCRTAKAASLKSSVLYSFARKIAQDAKQSRCATELLQSAEKVQTVAYQLRVLSLAGQDTVDDIMTRKVLMKNAENLKQAITDTISAMESVCLKGLHGSLCVHPADESQATDMISGWRQQLRNHRRIEANTGKVNDLGLRIVTVARTGPQLTDIFSHAEAKP